MIPNGGGARERGDRSNREGRVKKERKGEKETADKESADTEEGNVDIIRNIRDAVKVIRFHIRSVHSVGRVSPREVWVNSARRDRREDRKGIVVIEESRGRGKRRTART